MIFKSDIFKKHTQCHLLLLLLLLDLCCCIIDWKVRLFTPPTSKSARREASLSSRAWRFDGDAKPLALAIELPRAPRHVGRGRVLRT